MNAAPTTNDRRSELLDIAGRLFAERGLRATTVRDIADAAGILSGSLYHHFDSKESMVDEILRDFLDALFASDEHHAAVAIYQNEARRLAEQPRFAYIPQRLTEFRRMWHDVLKAGIADGTFRPDLDVELSYRFLRDTVWVGVGWYRPGGKLAIDDIARQYLSIVLDGIAHSNGATRG
jgi:AcrR family transcriptional regulator